MLFFFKVETAETPGETRQPSFKASKFCVKIKILTVPKQPVPSIVAAAAWVVLPEAKYLVQAVPLADTRLVTEQQLLKSTSREGTGCFCSLFCHSRFAEDSLTAASCAEASRR